MEPLKDPRTQIRLLRLLPGTEEETVWCTSSTHDLDSAPDYFAISYAWGDTNNSKQIGIGDHLRNVRNNCRYALWQARLHHSNAFVWIDSICINQDDLNEKSCQVALMGKIFGKATKVLACVGPGEDIEYMVNFSPEFVHQALQVADKDLHCNPELNNSFFQPAALSVESLWDQLRKKSSKADLLRFVTACGMFTLLPYWQRLWIMQELFMANEIHILYGGFNLPWTFVGNLNLFAGRQDTPEIKFPESVWLEILVRLCPMPGSASRIPLEMRATTLLILSHSRCEDKRDRIYGTLELFTWNNSKLALVPDYNLSAFSLAVSVLQCWRPQDVMGFSPHRLVSKLLKLDMNDVLGLAKQRRQPATVAIGSVQQSSTQIEVVCTRLRDDAKGRLTCCLQPNFPRTSYCEIPESLEPRIVFFGDDVAAAVCGSARAGDFLAGLNVTNGPCLVLRRSQQRKVDILGQGFVMKSHRICWDDEHCQCAQHGLKHDVTGKTKFDTTLDAEDVIVLLAQDWRIDKNGLDSFDPIAQMQRLVTRVSKCLNPTATLAEREKWKDLDCLDTVDEVAEEGEEADKPVIDKDAAVEDDKSIGMDSLEEDNGVVEASTTSRRMKLKKWTEKIGGQRLSYLHQTSIARSWNLRRRTTEAPEWN